MSNEVRYTPEIDIRSLSTKDIIKQFGGWNEGHYVFRTGEHGNGYIDKMGFLRYPNAMTEIGRRLAIQFDDLANDIDVVVGPSIIGAVLAYSTANELGVPFTITYRTDKDKSIQFHRGFIPEKQTRCLFVDDFVFSGKDLTDNINYMQNREMQVIGASVIGARHDVPLSVPMRNLMTVDFTKSSPELCDMCSSGVPITATNIRE